MPNDAPYEAGSPLSKSYLIRRCKLFSDIDRHVVARKMRKNGLQVLLFLLARKHHEHVEPIHPSEIIEDIVYVIYRVIW